MKSGFLEFVRNSLRSEEPTHPLDQRIAKRWVKERLKRLFPQFRNDPDALEKLIKNLVSRSMRALVKEQEQFMRSHFPEALN